MDQQEISSELSYKWMRFNTFTSRYFHAVHFL